MIDVINAKMAQAIRTITVEQGIEPRDFALVAFGGAGPMHAVFLAQELEIETVIVPKAPGAFSAWGMLQSLIRQDFAVPFYRALAAADPEEIVREFEAMQEQGRAALQADGVAPDRIDLQCSAEMRYEGQEYTINVPLALDAFGAGERPFDDLLERFHDAYLTRYGHANRDAAVEFVTLRLVGLGDLGHKPPADSHRGDADAADGLQRAVSFGGESRPTRIVMRASLAPGDTFEGPAIVEEDDGDDGRAARLPRRDDARPARW